MENINTATEIFYNFLIVKMGPCLRPSKEDADRLAEPLEGISRFQSIWIDQYDKLRGVEVSCQNCTVFRCAECNQLSNAIEPKEKFFMNIPEIEKEIREATVVLTTDGFKNYEEFQEFCFWY